MMWPTGRYFRHTQMAVGLSTPAHGDKRHGLRCDGNIGKIYKDRIACQLGFTLTTSNFV